MQSQIRIVCSLSNGATSNFSSDTVMELAEDTEELKLHAIGAYAPSI